MKISKIFSAIDEQNLATKMTKEFTRADNHTSNWKSTVENVGRDYLLPEPEEDKVKVRVIEWLIRNRKSVLLSDELQVTNIPQAWVLGQEVASNWDKVLQANYVSMDMKGMYEDVIVDDGLQWVAVLTVDWWNNHDQEPILSYIDSRLCFPDPDNWRGNKMKFFWTLVQKSIFELEADNAYDNERIESVRLQRSQELKDISRANNDIKWFTDTDVWEELVDLYNHITIFKSSKDKEHFLYLTTWGVDRTTLVRAVRMRALTETEKADPSKITLWVHLFRAHPIKWSFAWASLVDDSGQYQDLKTLMTNLLIAQAIEAWMWGKVFVDDALGIDTDDLASISWPAVIPYSTTDNSKNAANSIINETPRPNNPAVQNWIATIDLLNQEATWMSSLVQWQSLSWSQTKAEIQTLQQNINQGILLMANSYMTTLIWVWGDVMRSYAVNMSPQRKKEIVVMDTWDNARAYWFKKNEFVPKWDVYITIKSKAQEAIKNSQDFAQLLTVHWTLINFLKPGSTQANILNRMLIDKSGIKWLDWKTIVTFTADERKAYSNLNLLNNNIDLETSPEPWEDHDTYINIYKTWLQTDARDKAIEQRENILKATPKEAEAEVQTDWTAKQLWASLVSQKAAEQWGVSSLADVAV